MACISESKCTPSLFFYIFFNMYFRVIAAPLSSLSSLPELRRKTTGLPSFWQVGLHRIRNPHCTQSPVPPAGEAEMRQHLGVWGIAPAGVQRAEPFGARRTGAGVQRAAPSGDRCTGA